MDSNEGKKSLLCNQDWAKSLNVSSKLCIEPESHLQSLGFTINNGKAEFKLDEDAPLCTLTNFCTDDSDDTLSFVVLGKDSLDSIQQSSIASYVDIQQKCMSIDYNSMIASWDTAELHQKLSELLQENVKLKETLKQNNIAMKQHFNTIANWQEEIMKVHQNHKKKFSETRELINYLKKENTELKVRLSSDLTSHAEMGYELLDTNDAQDVTKEEEKGSIPANELTKSALSELETMLNESTDDKDTVSKQTTTFNGTVLDKSMGDGDIEPKQTATTNNEVKTTLNESIGNQDIEPKQTATTDNELKIMSNGSINEDMATIQTTTAETMEKIMELDKFSKSILSKFALTLNETTDDRDTILKQTATYEVIQKIMKLDKFNQLVLRKLDLMLSENIDDRDTVPKQAMTSKAVQKIAEIFSKVVLTELETLLNKGADGKDIVSKQNVITDAELETLLNENTGETTSGTVQKMVELEKQNSDNERLLEKERMALMKMRESIEEERKILDSREKNLEREYKNLKDAKDLLEQERISLREEQTSLDQMSQLYEVYYKKTLESEKKTFEERYDTMVNELGILHGSIEMKEATIKQLEKELTQHKENVNLLQTQLKVYEEDFNHERRMKETLLNEKSSLNVDLQRQIEYNERLQQEISRIRTPNHSGNRGGLEAPYVSTYSCPKCESIFTNIVTLESHISRCLELD
ncbi:uncharacterized protein LOC143423825 isoform X2 [Xylocopa sonorina]|uniref:uncharacterized protein LOC143423825 isoform X2 n=1 Tax=Xylocopa sonorina TaxID=1818115 RepID=UPI00403AA002